MLDQMKVVIRNAKIDAKQNAGLLKEIDSQQRIIEE